MRTWTLLLSLTLVLAGWPVVAAASGTRGTLPVDGAVVRAFDPPDVAWGTGHRGVDLAADAGALVLAPRDGVVTFAAELAGRPVLVLSHGETRTTFEPVVAVVAVGTHVSQGQPVGRLVAGHACPAASCLHWGLRRGEAYLDPLSLVRGEVRLLSDAAAATLRAGG